MSRFAILLFRWLPVCILASAPLLPQQLPGAHIRADTPDSGISPNPADPPPQNFQSSGPLIRVSTDTLWIMEQSFEVQQDVNLRREQMVRLMTGKAGALLTSLYEPWALLQAPNDSLPMMPPAKTPARSARYEYVLGQIVQFLSRQSDRRLEIVSGADHAEEASSLYRELVRKRYIRSGQVALRSYAPRLQEGQTDGTENSGERPRRIELRPPILRFQTSEGLQQADVQSWRLQIRDSGGNVIRSIAAQGRFPQEMTWDWKGGDGSVSKSAYYSYAVDWRNTDGTVHTAVAGYIKVIRTVRHIRLRLSTTLRLPLSRDESLYLIVR